MRMICLRFLTGLFAFVATLSLGQAQIVIPDINRNTIKIVPPPPVGFTGRPQNPATQSTESNIESKCKELPKSLQLKTPGCH
jgi:hypothetical protein